MFTQVSPIQVQEVNSLSVPILQIGKGQNYLSWPKMYIRSTSVSNNLVV